MFLPFRLGGDIPRQSPPLVWRGRLPGVPVRHFLLFWAYFSIIFGDRIFWIFDFIFGGFGA